MNLLRVLALGAIFTLVGCAASPVGSYVPQDKYKDIEPTAPVEEYVPDLPKLPKLKIQTIDSVQVATLDLEGVNALNQYTATSKHYLESLRACYSAYNASVGRDSLSLTVLRAEEQRGNNLELALISLRQDHQDALRSNTIEVFGYRTALIAMGLLFLL